MDDVSDADAVERGRAAVARLAWSEARDLLSAADAAGLLTPEDLDSLAEAAWWCGQVEQSIEARERAFGGLVEAGNNLQAALAAIRLFGCYVETQSPSVGMGWLKRAERLLENEAESSEHGYLEWTRTNIVVGSGDLDAALEHATKTLAIGERLGDPNIQALGLFDRGNIFVAKGQVAEGMALLEEAGVAAVSGELSPLVTGVIYCSLITTCGRLADYGRAAEWADAAERWCQRMSVSGFPGLCRVRRAEILRLRGAWTDAESQAKMAHDELRSFDLNAAAEAICEIGEIRLRMGDLEAAEEAFRQAHELGREPQPGLALLRLAEGEGGAAAAMVQRALANQSWDRLERARLLPAQVEIALAEGNLATARKAAEELAEIAGVFGTKAIRASATSAAGAVEAAEGSNEAAVSTLRAGWRLWQEIDAPYEAAKTRLLLGGAYDGCGDPSSAELELEAALSAFQHLGADLDGKQALGIREHGWPQAMETAVRSRTTKTFMFTDICRSTNLTEAMGDSAWEDVLTWHDQTLRSLFSDHGGEEVKQQGDGFFVAFDGATKAINCAIAIQHRLAENRRQHGFAPEVRIGLHAAEATRRGSDYSGKGINQAERIGSLANGGQILVSKETLPLDDGGFATSEPRPISLKGISESVEVVSIVWQ